MAGRMMRTLKTSVKLIKLNSVDYWKRALKIAVAAYKIVSHCATGYSPFKMLYGKEAIMPKEIPNTKFSTMKKCERVVK